MKQLFIAWTPFMRRPESMQTFFGYELHFIAVKFVGRWLKALEYLIKCWLTMVLLLRTRPDVIWIQLAPTPLLYLAFVYKWLFHRKLVIIADCHNSMYRRPWINLPGAVRLLNQCNRVLVHNNKMVLRAMQAGVKEKQLTVLETKPAQLEAAATAEEKPMEPSSEQTIKSPASELELHDGPWLLFPCSFDSDEPVEEVFAAARLIPHIRFVVTGNSAKYKGRSIMNDVPANVKLAGFLPISKYNELLKSCNFVMGLTTRDDVQLSVANEAVGGGKPMVISETSLLKELFYRGAIYVNPLDPHSIVEGCLEALERNAELSEDVILLKEERNERWLAQAAAVHCSVIAGNYNRSL